MILLPIRGWSAERMAVYMAAAAVQSAMPEDCPMRIQAAEAETNASPTAPKNDRSCQACQLCMSWAAQETPAPTDPAPIAFSHAAPYADRFASIDLARLVKPPIY